MSFKKALMFDTNGFCYWNVCVFFSILSKAMPKWWRQFELYGGHVCRQIHAKPVNKNSVIYCDDLDLVFAHSDAFIYLSTDWHYMISSESVNRRLRSKQVENNPFISETWKKTCFDETPCLNGNTAFSYGIKQKLFLGKLSVKYSIFFAFISSWKSVWQEGKHMLLK